MAVTGVFNADFSNFHREVTESTSRLKLLEAGADQVGGKFSKMGGDIPDGIKKITSETEKAEGATTGWAASLTKLAAGYLTLQSLQAVWGFAKDIMADADALENLSRQTRISTTDLQNLGNAGEQFGIDMDEMGRALFGLSKRIGSGDDSVNDALLQMGLSIEKVKGLDLKELLLTITDAAGNMNVQFKDAALNALFGDKLGQSVSGAAAEMRSAVEEQEKLNNAIGPEQVKALADAQSAMDTFYIKAKAWSAINVFAPLAKGLQEFIETAEKAGVWNTLNARFKDSLLEPLGFSKTAFADLRAEVGLLPPVVDASSSSVGAFVGPLESAAGAAKNLAGETKRLREEFENRYDPAKTLAGFVAATNAAKEHQAAVTAATNAENAVEQQRLATLTSKLQAGEGFMAQLNQTAKLTRENAEFEKQVATDQTAINETITESVGEITEAHTEAGVAAEAGTAATVAGYQAVQQQVEITSDGVRGWLELMRATNAANSLLNQNSLFTSGSTLENQARIGGAFSPIPGFASGIENFGGGLARVHGGEVLANLPKGTSVIPKGGLGANISNVFNLVDSESNLARRVADLIMRQVRAGTQLGTA